MFQTVWLRQSNKNKQREIVLFLDESETKLEKVMQFLSSGCVQGHCLAETPRSEFGGTQHEGKCW